MGPQLVRCGKHLPLEQLDQDLLASMGPQLVRCGKEVPGGAPLPAHELASMGPQLVRCGKTSPRSSAAPAPTRLQWGRNLFVAERVSMIMLARSVSCGFNGAATCSLRKGVQGSPMSTFRGVLQWGRNLFVAERRVLAAGGGRPDNASMGPQLVRCGKRHPRPGQAQRAWASMGPQLVRCGKILKPTGSLILNIASMGPQLVRCGKDGGGAADADDVPLLQWGRNLFVAERALPGGGGAGRGAASMGPQLVRCGKRATWWSSTRPTTRFNGAATCSLRKGADRFVSTIRNVKLQWGRNLFVAESDLARLLVDVAGVASMGPQLVRCGKTPGGTVGIGKQPVASMGPQLVRCGKPLQARQYTVIPESFNGAATCSLRKDLRQCSPTGRRSVASMGPQLVRCGKADIDDAGSMGLQRFNGAATCSLRKGRPAAGGRTAWPRFNGAATCSLRKGCGGYGNGRRGGWASMGPQLVRCGKMRRVGPRTGLPQKLQWGRNLFVAERPPPQS